MSRLLAKLVPFVIIAAGLTMLTIILGCLTSTSFPRYGRQMTALRQIFPSAIDIVEISQDAQVSGRPDEAKISEIKGDSGLLGYCVESKVVSRSGPFKIRVLLDPQLYIKQASVISYPWDRGRDVCKRAFTSQFEGKGPEDPIQLGNDIDAMTGATISSRVMAQGVRDTITLLKFVKENKLVKEKGIEKQTNKSISPIQQLQYTEEQFEQQTNDAKIVKIIHNEEVKGGKLLYRNNCSS